MKLANLLLVAGGLFVLGGLLFLPAGMGTGHDESALAGGAILFATGILIVAFSVYLKARALQAAFAQSSKVQRKKNKCEACEAEPANIRCAVHDIKLCSSCLPHHDISSCSYLPLSRRAAGASAN